MTHRFRAVGVFSHGIAKTPHVASLLNAQAVVLGPKAAQARELDAIVGWGNKPNTFRAREFARRHDLPYWRAEDGFLRSIGVGASGDAPLSVVLDDLGIYYDAGAPSRLETMLNADDDALDESGLLARAETAMSAIREAGLSKYNDAAPGAFDLGPRDPAKKRVLVIDQTAGDLSIRCGRADAGSFQRMLQAAIEENPGAEILVKTHPDVLAGSKHGHLGDASGSGVRVVAEPCSPIELLAQVDAVYAVTSQMGFEALIAGKPVSVFGAPFYAGWGLTDDRITVERRARNRTLAQLFAAAYILYPSYIDPDTGKPGAIEHVIAHLKEQRTQFARNRGHIFCFGFRVWKRGYVRQYMRCPGNKISFARDARHAEKLGFNAKSHIVTWGQRAGVAANTLSSRYEVPIWRMEDGFLRSVGLGSDLTTPASLVVDRQGIYYDPRTASELESILASSDFSEEETARAAALRKRIVETGISKYNVGTQSRIIVPSDRRVILVPGQVEDDASIQLGCKDIATNLGLLLAAREQAGSDAYIVFKPHPDVTSGNRRGAVDNAAAREICDHIEGDASLAECLAVAHEVHTMTSLVGFEALLRGKVVYTYGQPFYAGWGLTRDRHPHERRNRQLSLDELVAGTLLHYPRYLNQHNGTFTSPEYVMQMLVEERDSNPGARRLQVSWARRQLRKLAHAVRGVLHAS